MSIADLAKAQTYIGRFEVTETEINWFPELRWSEYRDFGDMVYFMFVDDKLMKIGKAANKGGWNGRVGMYKNGNSKRGDGTNKRILRVMKEIGEDTIHIYAIHTPREKISFTNPLNSDIIETEIETALSVEKNLTAQYLTESKSNQLMFSNQLSQEGINATNH